MTERKGDIVHDDKNAFQRNPLVLHPVANGFAAQVHVGRGLQHDELLAAVTNDGDGTVAVGGKRGAGACGKGVGDKEAGVMAGVGVLGADVAQADDQVFHKVVLVFGVVQR